MLKNYFKIAIRTIRRHPGYSLINVLGLTIGVACSLIIGLYVFDELQYDRFHEHASDIYRIQVGDDQEVTPTIISPLIQRSLPDVDASTRLYDVGRYQARVVAYESTRFLEERFFYADSTVFDVFTLPLVAGNPAEALVRPRTLVLSASTARKYFGDANPIGALLQVDNSTYFEVTGVMADLPAQSHLQFDFLASFATLRWATREIWDTANFYTYARLQPRVSKEEVVASLDQLVASAHEAGQVQDGYRLTLHPLLGIRLYTEGQIRNIILLSTVALLVLLIACVNYVNLATARASQRAREVGVRKVAGAGRKQLIVQFMGESLLTALMAVILACLVARAALPVFNALSGKDLSMSITDPWLWGIGPGIAGLVGIIGGIYPALLLSSFRPASILKQYVVAGGGRLRRILVVAQFTISIILMVGTIVVYQQMRFIQDKELGFDKEQLIVVPLGFDQTVRSAYDPLRNTLLQAPEIISVSAISQVPGYQEGGYGLWTEGMADDSEDWLDIGGVPSDPHVVETLGLQLVAGEGFVDRPADSLQNGNYQYLLNEAAVRATGWRIDEAIGKRVALSSNRTGTVVGVLKDYHFLSLHEAITPLAYFVEPSSIQHMLIRTVAGGTPGALQKLEELWTARLPHRPFTYSFLDDELDRLYRAEQQTSKVFSIAAGLALFIACLGLFGLAAFSTTRRTKEVGIRKTLGATEAQIVFLLSSEFTRLVLIGFVIAVPVAYLIMNRWLEAFAYQISITMGLFAIVGCAVMLIAWVTISTQAIRTALADPVKSLRHQ